MKQDFVHNKVSMCSDIEKYGEFLMTQSMVDYDSFSIMNMKDVIIITRYHRKATWPVGKQELYGIWKIIKNKD